MILTNYIDFLLGLAVLSFVFFLFVKLFMNVKNFWDTIKGMIIFLYLALTYPVSFANEIYSKRIPMIKKINSDKTIPEKRKIKLKKLVKSRMRLYFNSYVLHIVEFPNFIERFSIAYKKAILKRVTARSKQNHITKAEVFGEIQFNFTKTFDALKQKYS